MAKSFYANISTTARQSVLRLSAYWGVVDYYDLAKFQGHLSRNNGVIGGQRSNFDLEYLRQGVTYDLEIFIVGEHR